MEVALLRTILVRDIVDTFNGVGDLWHPFAGCFVLVPLIFAETLRVQYYSLPRPVEDFTDGVARVEVELASYSGSNSSGR